MESEFTNDVIELILYVAGSGFVLGLASLLSNYIQGGICTATTRLDGKVVLITGGNTGIGKETAKDLAKRGAKVYIAAWPGEDRSPNAVDEIKKESGNSDVHLRFLDLASFSSIREFVKNFQNEEKQLHILINNAAVFRCPYWKTADGLEMQMGVNYFGHFLLTNLLLDTMKSSGPARIINVSSFAHETAKINFDNLNSEKHYNPREAYNQSKLANVLFTRELHRRLEDSDVSAFSLHPGLIKTGLERHWVKDMSPIFYRIMLISAVFFFKSPKQGAQTSIYCAVEPGLEKESGNYFSDCKVKEPADVAKNDGVAKKLWELSEKVVGL